VRETIFNQELYDTVEVSQLMHPPSATISPSDGLHNALNKFDETREWNLPVTDKGKYMGFLSKSSILSKYRNELVRSA
jgi:CIC family chloride channel protein